MGCGLICTEQTALSAMQEHSLGQLIQPLIREIYLYHTYVAGTSYVEEQCRFNDLVPGDDLILKREPDNEYDERAILVLNNRKEKLGYVPRAENIVFSRLMDAGKILKAKVRKKDLSEYGHWEAEMEIYLVDL